MADLKRIPGCHVYWGTAPLAAGLAKLPKEKVILFNIDTEAEPELKDVQSTKTPFDKERPTPLDSFDVIVKTLIDEGEKTQCVFNSKEELPATLGNFCLIFFFRYVNEKFLTNVAFIHISTIRKSAATIYVEM